MGKIPRKIAKTWGWPGFSQISATAFAKVFDCFISKGIKFSCTNIFLELFLPSFRIEFKKPIPKTRQIRS